MRDLTIPGAATRRRWLWPLAALGLALSLLAGLLAAPGEASRSRGTVVKVMTRNLYLGATLDDAIASQNAQQFASENGEILRDVDTNNFPVRSRGLAREILRKSPDLVGLQEVALYRTNDTPTLNPLLSGAPKTATQVHPGGDFLALLMSRLNQGQKRYRVVKVQQEIDVEAPADYNNQPNDSDANDGFTNTVMPDAEIQARLTMRDVIIVKRNAGVRLTNVRGENYESNVVATISGVQVEIVRGWVAADAVVRGSRKFRFINTHLESIGDDANAAQARELVARGGPARGRLPVVLVGDLNSDDNTQQGGERDAYLVLKRRGFVDRATEDPMSCCLQSEILTADRGSRSDFDHHIDHILTNRPRAVRRISSAVTGLAPVNGFWNSDHAGVFSVILVLG